MFDPDSVGREEPGVLQQNQPPDPPAQPKQHPGDFIDPTGLEAETAENAVAVMAEQPKSEPAPKPKRKAAPKKRAQPRK